MSRDKFHTKNEEPLEDWLLSYADMITLVMAFFVMLAAISKVDANLFEKVQSGLAEDIGNRVGEKPMENMRRELSDVISAYKVGEDAADVGTDERGVVITLDSGTMFAPGSAIVQDGMLPLLREMATTLGQPRFANYRYEIQGHTDDTAIASQQYGNNFELGAARALATLRVLAESGVPPERMLAASYGQYAPRVPNRREDGTPLPVNQSLNRRVTLHIYPR